MKRRHEPVWWADDARFGHDPLADLIAPLVIVAVLLIFALGWV
jgi:hypothetical protein